MPLAGIPRKTVKRMLVAGILSLLAIVQNPQTVQAQAVQYTSVSRGEFGGMMGMMMTMAPEAQEPTRETVYIKGTRMRADQGDTSTITDMANGTFTVLNHADKTWYSMNMEDMAARMSGMAGQWDQAAAEAPMEENESDQKPEVEVKVTTDRTGKTRQFDGYSAEQVLMTMEVVPLTEEARSSAEATGNMVMFTELWLSQDFPGAQALKEAQEEFAAEGLGAGGAGDFGAAFQQAFSQDPRLKEAFEKNMEEMAEVDGIPVRTVTSMVLVPTGQEFDPQAVLDASDQPLESTSMGDLMGQAAGSAASDAAREAMGRLGSMFGRKDKEEEKPAEASPTQATVMRITSTMEDVRTTDIPDSVFQPPADYREQEPEWTGGGSGG